MEDADVKLQRASASLLSDLEQLLPNILWKHKHDSGSSKPHLLIREADVGRIFALIEPFQEDPQLLDTHLKTFIPPLVAAYLESLQVVSRPQPKRGFFPTSHAICQILNLLCKVRGDKIVKGFLNNEPRYLEPILNEFETGKNYQESGEGIGSRSIVPWTERYILLLWLSHLMLAPFPLASMSILQSSSDVSSEFSVELPSQLPEISLRVLAICLRSLHTASKERSAAATLLVRLCVRPDMQAFGLLNNLVKWSLSFYSKTSEDQSDIHQCLGVLSFLSGLVSSATNEEIGPFLPAIFQSCQNIISKESLAFVKSSAVARKLLVKALRSVGVHCIQNSTMLGRFDSMTALEEIIEFLVESLADGDSPVRFAASKGLSLITMKLDPQMAADIVEAVLGSFNENVYWQNSKQNLSGVNPLQWHGLTLTLSHLLYKKAISATQLPDILNALLLSLGFEQRSVTGGSIGTNVRDAACFGIWALSRRYTTQDLLAVDTSAIRASERQRDMSVPQVLATELLVAGCFDPAGNIRRGSSAALQELIGRHPNTVEEGITLVQIVDFHAVGLRERAMCQVAVTASRLSQKYWEALFDNLLGWRGIGSLDSASRLFAASSVGVLSNNQNIKTIRRMFHRVCARLSELKSREVEERQALVYTLAALLRHSTQPVAKGGAHASGILVSAKDQKSTLDSTDLTRLWNLLDKELNLEDKSFMSPALRPELTTSSICNFLGALSSITHQRAHDSETPQVPTGQLIRLLNLSLGRYEESVLEALPETATNVVKLLGMLDSSQREELVAGWLSKLENEASYNELRCSGHAMALGAVYSLLYTKAEVEQLGTSTETQVRILNVLSFRCTSTVAVEARVVALRALEVLMRKPSDPTGVIALPVQAKEKIANALHIALNDYTVTERGDVGALVRLEALNTLREAWKMRQFAPDGTDLEKTIYADSLRLSLEKLDKMRTRAARAMEQSHLDQLIPKASYGTDNVSSYAYFTSGLELMQHSTPNKIKEALCLGFVSSAGMGSESVVQNSRLALLDMIDSLPTCSTPSGGDKISLLDIVERLADLLKQHIEVERVLLPLLEVFAFLFDMQVMHRLVPTSFNFRKILSYTQKAHFKSTHMQKLHLALDVYRGLGTIPATQTDTINKVTSMLLHPFPKIRITAAETLWMLTQEDELKKHDWGLPPKNLRNAVNDINASIFVV